MNRIFIPSVAASLLCFLSANAALEVKNNASSNNSAVAKRMLESELAPLSKNIDAKIVLNESAQLRNEEWQLTGDGKVVTITAGKNGFILGSIHYMENICGSYVFSPHEKQFADDAKIKLQFAPASGNPDFMLRDLYFLSQLDQGASAIRRGLNSQGETIIPAKFGGNNFYGSPKFCHTFHLYFPQQKYFKDHPEWFSEINGKRIPYNKRPQIKVQLCLSNNELRDAFFAKLLNFIASDRAKAAQKGLPAPIVYDISMNDVLSYCTCKECNALAAKYGNKQSGVMLDFVNDLARRVRVKYPEIFITTFAYLYTEEPPVNITAEKNVVIVLCDTQSNTTVPLDHPDNKTFYNKLKNWSKVAEHIRIWDYNVNFAIQKELPYNSEDTYQKDLQIFQKYNVKQVFGEHEWIPMSDARDYKIFLKTQLLLNNKQDVEALKKRFADVYFGKAGKLFLQYRSLLKKSQESNHPFIDMNANPMVYSHLDFDTVYASQKLFDEGEKILADDPARLRRWRSARLSLDRATLLLRVELMREYFRKNGTLANFPFDIKAVKDRIEKQYPMELEKVRKKEVEKVSGLFKAELERYNGTITEKTLTVPEKFKNLPQEDVFDFPIYKATTHDPAVKVVDDPESISGQVLCYERDKFEQKKYYTFPLPYGVYSRKTRLSVIKGKLPAKDVKPGYNWYHLGTGKITPESYFHFFGSWDYQQYFSTMTDTVSEFEFHLHLKFTGKVFGGKAEDKNAIYIDRLVLVRKSNTKQ